MLKNQFEAWKQILPHQPVLKIGLLKRKEACIYDQAIFLLNETGQGCDSFNKNLNARAFGFY